MENEKRILSFGDCGWGSFEYGDFHGSISYLEDTPMDILDAILEYVEAKRAVAVYVEEEGSNWTLVISNWDVYIISEREKPRLYSLDVNLGAFMKQLVKDCEDQKEQIVHWDCDPEMEKEEVEKRRAMLKEKVEKCREYLEKY